MYIVGDAMLMITVVFRSVDPIHLGGTGIRMLNVHNLHTLDSLTPVPSG